MTPDVAVTPIPHGPLHVLWGDSSPSRHATEMAFLANQLSGRERFVRQTQLGEHTLIPEQLLPAGAEIIGWCEDRLGLVVHARAATGSILIEMYGRATTVTVSAPSVECLDRLHGTLIASVPQRSAAGTVSMTVWMGGDRSAVSRRRSFPAPTWASVQANYPSSIRAQLDRLMALREPDLGGRLIVWYGEPGTGKTNAIRALARSWADWCDTHVLADPEAIFASSKAIDEVLVSGAAVIDTPTMTSARRLAPSWRLIVAEDTDELLRATNDARGGGAMARLFNVADGIVGQGAQAIFLITTNAPVRELHPALLRPGRCLSRIEFERFTSDEARQWLPSALSDAVTGPMTLAELYELRGDVERIEHHRTDEARGYL